MQSLGGPELPPALRVKTVPTQTGMNEWDILRVDRRIEIVLRWLEVLEQACGRKCVLSTNGAFLQRTLGSGAALAGYDLWIADYRTAAPPAAPSPWNRWTFWRYSESGDFPGLTGRVSLNYFNGSRAELDKYASVQTAAVTETPAAVEPAPGQPLEPVPPIAGSDTGTEGPPAPSDAAEPEPAAQDDRGPTDAGEPSRRTRRAARREGGQGT
jgi:hypothetical protein